MALKIRFASTFTFLKIYLFLFILAVGFYFPAGSLPVPIASASAGYGIQGQMAPELNLSNWIDGNGHKTDPVNLGDYRGKVVYLYFFQDW